VVMQFITSSLGSIPFAAGPFMNSVQKVPSGEIESICTGLRLFLYELQKSVQYSDESIRNIAIKNSSSSKINNNKNNNNKVYG